MWLKQMPPAPLQQTVLEETFFECPSLREHHFSVEGSLPYRHPVNVKPRRYGCARAVGAVPHHFVASGGKRAIGQPSHQSAGDMCRQISFGIKNTTDDRDPEFWNQFSVFL